jgi:hypothetical protein
MHASGVVLARFVVATTVVVLVVSSLLLALLYLNVDSTRRKCCLLNQLDCCRTFLFGCIQDFRGYRGSDVHTGLLGFAMDIDGLLRDAGNGHGWVLWVWNAGDCLNDVISPPRSGTPGRGGRGGVRGLDHRSRCLVCKNHLG